MGRYCGWARKWFLVEDRKGCFDAWLIHSAEGIGELNSKSGFMGRRKGEYVVSKNVAVRQSNWEAEDEGDSVVDVDMETVQEMLAWNGSIGSGETVDLTLVWEVNAPAGVAWTKK